LIDIVSIQFPGDSLRLTLERRGETIETVVELVRYSEFDEALAEFEDFIGGKLSERRTGFAKVLQHDSAIRPVHCGGPVVDINGRFVGINIARAARTTSYLLPVEEVKLAIARLKERRTDHLQTVDVRAVNK
jgi:serine protease Do